MLVGESLGREWALVDVLIRGHAVRLRRGSALRLQGGCFTGNDAVWAFLNSGLVRTHEEAVLDGRWLATLDLIRPTGNRGGFRSVGDFDDSSVMFRLNCERMMNALRACTSPSLLVEDVNLLWKLISEDLAKTLRVNFRRHENVFVGSEAVKLWVGTGVVRNVNQAVQCGKRLLQTGFIRHVTGRHVFKNSPKLMYTIVKCQKEVLEEERGAEGKRLSSTDERCSHFAKMKAVVVKKTCTSMSQFRLSKQSAGLSPNHHQSHNDADEDDGQRMSLHASIAHMFTDIAGNRTDSLIQESR